MVTDDNGQFSTSAEWASHKHNTNAGKTSEDGVWFGTSEPDDSKGALPYDTYIIEELRSDNKMMKNDIDYKVNVMDERNISIKEKSGNITNMITMVLLSIATVIFISFDYLIPAIITGVIIAVQPIVLIIVSNMIEKKM